MQAVKAVYKDNNVDWEELFDVKARLDRAM